MNCSRTRLTVRVLVPDLGEEGLDPQASLDRRVSLKGEAWDPPKVDLLRDLSAKDRRRRAQSGEDRLALLRVHNIDEDPRLEEIRGDANSGHPDLNALQPGIPKPSKEEDIGDRPTQSLFDPLNARAHSVGAIVSISKHWRTSPG